MKRLILVIGLVTCLLSFQSLAEAQFSYSGSLDLSGPPSADGLLIGTYNWGVDTTTLEWTVTWTGNQYDYVHYSYTLTVPDHAPSYFILETSDTFTSADITNVTGGTAQVGTWIPNPDNTGGQYQTMPESVYGVKFDGLSGANTITIEFDSTRLPEWGDFYSRCGVRPQHESGELQWNSTYNAGFTVNDTDPNAAASSGSIDNHLLVPNTIAVVPEPVSSTLFVIGSVFFAGRRFMKRKK